MYETLAQAFQAAIEKGEIRSMNTNFAAHSFLSILKVGHYREANQKTIFDTNEEAAKQIVDMFWSGIYDV